MWALQPIDVPNYNSVLNHNFDVVDNVIMNDIKNGWVIEAPWKPRVVTTRGAVPKPHTINEVRIITDLSAPAGRSVNDLRTPPKFCMSTFDDAVKLVKKGCWVCKVDLKSAYRHIGIHPDNWELFGFEWRGKYWLDIRLCFGLNTAPWVFTQFTEALVWIAKQNGIPKIIGYIDDFLIIADSKEECQRYFEKFCALLAELGFEKAPKKCIEPCQCLEFLGITLDTTVPEARLSPEQRQRISEGVTSFLDKSVATARELQSLAGTLNNASKVVHGGRTFLRRLIDLINTAHSWDQKLRLTEDMKLDLLWWRDFSARWDGRAIFIDPLPVSPLQFQTDACTGVGCGAFFDGKALQISWKDAPRSLEGVHINILEVYPALLAAREWGHLWKGRHVVVWTDSTVAVAAFNRGTSTTPIVMEWLRELFFLSALHNFRFTARHVPGKVNVLADALSRFVLFSFEFCCIFSQQFSRFFG